MTGALLALCVLSAAAAMTWMLLASCVLCAALLDAGARDAAPAPTERPDIEGHAGVRP